MNQNLFYNVALKEVDFSPKRKMFPNRNLHYAINHVVFGE